MSSASILLNGVQIVGPRDFNRTVPTIVRPVALAEQNQLTIRLASSPGSFLAVSVECEASPVLLSAGGPGVSLLQTSTLLSAQPIRNSGTAPAENVQLSAINLNEGTLTIPTSIPFGLGTIPVDDSVVLDTNFVGTFFPLQGYDLSLEGTYDVGAATYCFTLDSELVVPPGAPGSRFIDSATVEQNQVSDAPFPHQPREPRSLDFVNGPLWSVPLGPFTPGTPTPTETQLQVARSVTRHSPISRVNREASILSTGPSGRFLSGRSLPAHRRPRKRSCRWRLHSLRRDRLMLILRFSMAVGSGVGFGPIVFRANNGLGLTSGGTNGTTSSIAEPSGASNAEGVIFATANWVASFSMDGGGSFTQLDPTTILPPSADAVGFC